MDRKATATWKGDIKAGNGVISTQSLALDDKLKVNRIRRNKAIRAIPAMVTHHHRARSAAHSARRARIDNRDPCLNLSTH
jgi:hypothetical protein